MTSPARNPRRAWFAGAVGVLTLAAFAIFGFQRGQCFDAAPGTGAESYCTVGPAIGIPGAWVLGLVALVAAIAMLRRVGRGD